MKVLLVAFLISLFASTAMACSGGTHPEPASPEPASTVHVPVGGGDIRGATFSSVIDLAHNYQSDIIVPIGIPVGVAQAEEDAAGTLGNYGYQTLGGIGDVYVFGAAPTSVADFDTALPHPADFTEIRRSVVRINGVDALLVQERPVKYAYLDRFRLLWRQGGRLVQAAVASAGYQGSHPTVGPDALAAIATATRIVKLADVGTAGILLEPAASAVPFRGDVSTVKSLTEAARTLGGPVHAPATFAYVHVVQAGVVKSYTVDLDAQGIRRLFIMPGPVPSAADATAPGVTGFQTTTVGGKPGVYESVHTAAGSVSLLFFEAYGTSFLLRDASGGSMTDLIGTANSLASPSTPTNPMIVVGSPSLVNGKVQVPVSTTGSGLAAYSGVSIHLRWTPAVFSYSSYSITGTVLPSPFCVASVADDPDRGGVILACGPTGSGPTTTAGLLATIVLAPSASGCSPLHLFTLGGSDGGNTTTGTYTIDAVTDSPQIMATVDGTANISGQTC